MPDGKPENVFGFDGAYKDPEFAAKVFIQTSIQKNVVKKEKN